MSLIISLGIYFAPTSHLPSVVPVPFSGLASTASNKIWSSKILFSMSSVSKLISSLPSIGTFCRITGSHCFNNFSPSSPCLVATLFRLIAPIDLLPLEVVQVPSHSQNGCGSVAQGVPSGLVYLACTPTPDISSSMILSRLYIMLPPFYIFVAKINKMEESVDAKAY